MKHFNPKHLLLLLPMGILLFVQLPNLSLPYFWDEAWSYFTAINAMAEAGPTLLPGVVPLDYCKGHPQFFFFITSAWMNLFPNSVSMMRLLPLLFSMGVIAITYWGLLKIANWPSAIFGATLISVQSMFLAQSIFLLPEMLMSLFFVLSFFFFLNRNYIGYAISSTLMVLTKETTIVFALTFGAFYLLSLLGKTDRSKFKLLHLVYLITPGIIYALFLLLHYKAFKVFLYGEHLNYVAFDWLLIKDKATSALNMIFIRFGRSSITIVAIISFVLLFFMKKIEKRAVILATVSFLSYMIFSVFNFYTQRYGLVALIIFIILFAYNWGQMNLNIYLKSAVVLLLSIICLSQSLTKKSNSDIDLGYAETIRVHQEMTNYCVSQTMQEEPIAASFNMIFNLRDKNLGYVISDKAFNNVGDWRHYRDSRYILFESTSTNNEFMDYSRQNYKLLKQFSNKHAWGEIYENPNYVPITN